VELERKKSNAFIRLGFPRSRPSNKLSGQVVYLEGEGNSGRGVGGEPEKGN
jgi:hypothetical protein